MPLPKIFTIEMKPLLSEKNKLCPTSQWCGNGHDTMPSVFWSTIAMAGTCMPPVGYRLNIITREINNELFHHNSHLHTVITFLCSHLNTVKYPCSFLNFGAFCGYTCKYSTHNFLWTSLLL